MGPELCSYFYTEGSYFVGMCPALQRYSSHVVVESPNWFVAGAPFFTNLFVAGAPCINYVA